MSRSSCSSCKQRVMWVRHYATGNPAPLDPSPVDVGNVVLSDDGETYRVLSLEEERGWPPGPRYVLHFVTCPNAKKHRRSA